MKRIKAVYSPSEGKTLYLLDLGDGPELYSREALQDHFKSKKRAPKGARTNLMVIIPPYWGTGQEKKEAAND